jgi:hypothetical protein
MLGMMTARLDVMVFGVAGVTVGAVGVVRRFFMIACLVMLGGFAMVLCRMFMVLSRLVVMLDAFVVAHSHLLIRC